MGLLSKIEDKLTSKSGKQQEEQRLAHAEHHRRRSSQYDAKNGYVTKAERDAASYGNHRGSSGLIGREGSLPQGRRSMSSARSSNKSSLPNGRTSMSSGRSSNTSEKRRDPPRSSREAAPLGVLEKDSFVNRDGYGEAEKSRTYEPSSAHAATGAPRRQQEDAVAAEAGHDRQQGARHGVLREDPNIARSRDRKSIEGRDLTIRPKGTLENSNAIPTAGGIPIGVGRQ